MFLYREQHLKVTGAEKKSSFSYVQHPVVAGGEDVRGSSCFEFDSTPMFAVSLPYDTICTEFGLNSPLERSESQDTLV